MIDSKIIAVLTALILISCVSTVNHPEMATVFYNSDEISCKNETLVYLQKFKPSQVVSSYASSPAFISKLMICYSGKDCYLISEQYGYARKDMQNFELEKDFVVTVRKGCGFTK